MGAWRLSTLPYQPVFLEGTWKWRAEGKKSLGSLGASVSGGCRGERSRGAPSTHTPCLLGEGEALCSLSPGPDVALGVNVCQVLSVLSVP